MTDHFVVGVGYDDSAQEFGCYDTWDNNIHWYTWRGMGSGINYGVFGFNKFSIETVFSGLDYQLYNERSYKIIDLLGREVNERPNTPLFYLYDDGTVKKKMIIE